MNFGDENFVIDAYIRMEREFKSIGSDMCYDMPFFLMLEIRIKEDEPVNVWAIN